MIHQLDNSDKQIMYISYVESKIAHCCSYGNSWSIFEALDPEQWWQGLSNAMFIIGVKPSTLQSLVPGDELLRL